MIAKIAPARGSAKRSRNYANDEKNKLFNQALGDKVQDYPLRLNLAPSEDIILALDNDAIKVQRGRNTRFKIILSFEQAVIFSPRQMDYVVDRYCYRLSAALTVLAPNKPGKKLSKKERRLRRDLRDQIGEFTTHDNTDNIHVHGEISMVDKRTGRVMVINDGFWKIANQYAVEQTMKDIGELALDAPSKYALETANGMTRVIDLEERKIQEMLHSLLDPKGQEKRKAAKALRAARHPEAKQVGKTAAQIFRQRPNPGELFREIVGKVFPFGPPPKPERAEDETFEAFKTRQHQARREFDELLRQNNMGLRAVTYKNPKGEKLGGLVLSSFGEYARMCDDNPLWTKAAIEAFTLVDATGGNWQLGLGAKAQVLAPNMVTYEQWREKHPDPELVRTESQLPWQEYSVEIRQMDGLAHGLGRVELTPTVLDDYIQFVRGVKKAGKKQKQRSPAATMHVRPCCRPGELLLVIHTIPQENIERFREKYQPTLVMQVGKNFTAALLLHYDINQRWFARNARRKVGNDIVKEFGAVAWSDGFLMPGVPQLDGQEWITPQIIGRTQLKVSEAAQELLAPAWQKIMAEERAWFVRVARIKEKRQGLEAGTIKINPDLNFREPLRRGGPDVSSPLLADAERMQTPIADLRKKEAKTRDEDELEKKQELPAPSPAPPVYPFDEEEEKKRRKQEQEQQQNAGPSLGL